MATSSELKEIEDLIFQYDDTADKEQKRKLIKTLQYHIRLIRSSK
jgi:hypothetical protein